MYVNEDILQTLREARRTKGLSQRQLGERVGLPQSHISKIEGGGSDLKLSTLIEIARALELDVKLIPRATLPAVESVVKAASRDVTTESTSRAVDRIHRAQRIAERLSAIEAIRPNLAKLQGILAPLERFRFNRPDLTLLSKALEPLDLVRKRVDQLALPLENLGGLPTAYIEPINASARQLTALRNQMAHAPEAHENRQLPAHRLDDDDE